MKKKLIRHPRFYKKIIENTSDQILVEYIDNEFDENFNRRVKIEKFINDNTIIIDEFINKLNSEEFNKLNRFIKTQVIVMKHHEKNKNYDTLKVVKGSIELLNEFRGLYGF
tara:strand:- start:308 stop:640 length:333 start_codon:yes stop_codon:yes gene_type:complete